MSENWDLTQGVDEIQLLKEKVEALTEIVHNSNFVLVVRCKDCKYAYANKEPCLCEFECFFQGGIGRHPNDFCSRGERRKVNGNDG